MDTQIKIRELPVELGTLMYGDCFVTNDGGNGVFMAIEDCGGNEGAIPDDQLCVVRLCSGLTSLWDKSREVFRVVCDVVEFSVG